MKQIQAIIQPFKLSEVTNALQQELQLEGVTVVDVSGYGVSRGADGLERPATGSLNFVGKALVLMVLRDDQVSAALDVIVRHAQTGQVGDGIAFVLPVDDAVRIRNGARGEEVL